MEVSIDDLLATSTTDGSWNFEAMDPSLDSVYIDDSFLNMDEGISSFLPINNRFEVCSFKNSWDIIKWISIASMET